MKLMRLRRIISWGFILLALWFISPPGLPPDDFINLILGGYIADWLNISLIHGVLITYTVIPIGLLYIGCVICPGDTETIFKRWLDKIRKLAMRFIEDTRLLFAGIVILIMLYWAYIHYISSVLGI